MRAWCRFATLARRENLCLYNLCQTVSQYNMDLKVVHIRRKDNDLADALSPNRLDKVNSLHFESLSDATLSLSL